MSKTLFVKGILVALLVFTFFTIIGYGYNLIADKTTILMLLIFYFLSISNQFFVFKELLKFNSKNELYIKGYHHVLPSLISNIVIISLVYFIKLPGFMLYGLFVSVIVYDILSFIAWIVLQVTLNNFKKVENKS